MGKDRKNEPLQCSFCGKRHGEVKKLIAGPGVYICNDCVWFCNDILHADGIVDGPPEVLPSPELVQMSLLDFLRQAFGSPAVSNITMGRLIEAYQKYDVTRLARSVTALPPSEPPASEPPEPSAGDIVWKFRGESGLNYNFHGLAALQKWASNLSNSDGASISINGKSWKRYGSFRRLLHQGLTPAKALAAADLAGSSAGVDPDNSGSLESEE